MAIELLFAANMIILVVFAAALALAGNGRLDEPYWRTWAIANVVLAVALLFCTFDSHLPPLLVGALPNGLLVLGLALRWYAAREFGQRRVPAWFVWGPPSLLVLIALSTTAVSYAVTFTAGNIILTAIAAATAYEFWRDRRDGLPSRYALAVAYGIMAVSFAVRIGQGIADGATMPTHMPHDGALLVHLIVAVIHTVASGAFSLSLGYERANRSLAYAADHDALTGLLNRRAFERVLRNRIDQGPDRGFAVALIDIDHFKLVNDRLGHAAGDAALRDSARICSEMLVNRGQAARVGGEEFALLLEDVDRLEAALVMDALREAVARNVVEIGETRFGITISGGICHSADTPADYDAIMRRADARLYEAKASGRNRIADIAA